MNKRLAAALLAVLLQGGMARLASASAPPEMILRGVPVAEALLQLRGHGLTVLFSDRLVTADLRVLQDTAIGAPRDAAEQILAAHGLRLRNLRPGLFVVVRSPKIPLDVAPAAPESEPLTEIAIYASRYSVASPATSTVQLERTDIETLAGLDEDALRVAQTLPGTASTPLSARTHVRGGRDDEMLVRFDGIPQLAPFHFKDFGAVLGSIEPATIDGLDFYSGVFPVRHGDRLSAVMEMHPRSAREGTQHEFGVSLLATHALSVGETNLSDAPTRWLVAGRSSSAGWVARAAGLEDIEIEFSDVLARGERVIGDWTLIAGLSVLQDELAYRNDPSRANRRTAGAGYRDSTFWLRMQQPADGARHFAFSVARFELTGNRQGVQSGNFVTSGEVTEDRQSVGHYLNVEWRQRGVWMLGAELLDLRSRYDHHIAARFDPALAAVFARPPAISRRSIVNADTTTLSAYASRLLSLSSRWRVDLGVRVDHRNQPRDSLDWSPRVAMEFELSEGRFLRASAGRTSQGQRADELQVADGDFDFYPAQKADQWVLGYEQVLSDRGSWRLEAYRKRVLSPSPRFENLLDPATLIPELEIDRRRIAPDGALAYGIEFSGRRPLDDQWSGFMNYAWSEVEDRLGSTAVPRAWNQQHALHLGLTWSADPWTLSALGSWRTGWRRTEFTTEADGTLGTTLGERNRARWPAQWNLDLRATWHRPLPRGVLEVVIDVNNLTNTQNPCCTELRLVETGLITRTRSWLPRYFNVGVTWKLP